MTKYYLDFEKDIVELEEKIDEKKKKLSPDDENGIAEINELENELNEIIKKTFSSLTIWQRVQLARHQKRPYTLDYISRITDNFIELHGDRLYADDPALITGLAKIDGKSLVLIGHQKGRDTKSNIYRNFGMANPEGYRKALRVMKLGAKYNKPIINLIDTPGAFPGKGAEERGVAEAIAKNLFEMAVLPVPILCIITGEGGSGGALAIGVGDRVLMLENSIYSVISPEGCASIIFRDVNKSMTAAKELRITSYELLELGLIDGVIPEPPGGAHREVDKMAEILKEKILNNLEELNKIDTEILIKQRIDKFSKMGFWEE